MRNLLFIFGLTGAFVWATPESRAAFSDDFNTAQASATYNGSAGLSSASTLITANYTRSIYASITSNSAPGDARDRVAIANGAFTFSSDNEVTGRGDDFYSFSTPISLTLTPVFQFTILNNDVAGSIVFYVGDTTGTSVSTSVPLPVVLAGAPVVLTVPANTLGINASSVNSLQFFFGGTRGEDLSIDSIAAVPEPGSLAWLGVAAGVGWLARRRRA